MSLVFVMKWHQFSHAIHQSFTKPRDWLTFAIASAAVFALFVLVPVWTTPGNDIAFQLHLLKAPTYALMIVLSLSNGLLITMQRTLARHRAAVKVHAGHVATGTGIVVASVFATLACASCYSSLLAIFGLGGTLFVAKYHWWIAAAALILTAFALYHTARALTGECKVCATGVK